MLLTTAGVDFAEDRILGETLVSQCRQRHIGDALDKLAELGRLMWRWDSNVETRRAIYHVALTDKAESALGTRRAETVVVQNEYHLIGEACELLRRGEPSAVTARRSGMRRDRR